MSRQQSETPDAPDIARAVPGQKRKPVELWVTYKWLNGTVRTFRKARYRTSEEAKVAGEGMLRKHPKLYLSYEIRFPSPSTAI